MNHEKRGLRLNRELAVALREYLDSVDYMGISLALRGLGFFVNPWPPFYETYMAVNRLPPRLRTILRLLYLGVEVDYHDAHTAIETTLLRRLEDAGILRLDQGRVRNLGYALVCFQGLTILASLPPQYPAATSKGQPLYLGRDSYGLAHFIASQQGEDALDLCSGCGIQALVLARRFRRVWAVEILPEAVEAIKFNAALNGLDERIRALRGDLFTPVEGRRFDLVVCNPPYLPIPPTINYPITTNGGEDGLAVMRRVIEGLEAHLKPRGLFASVGEGPGDRAGPLLVKLLQGASSSSVSYTLIQASRETIELMTHILSQAVAQVLGEDPQRIGHIYREHFSSLGCTHYYHYFIRGRRGPPGLQILKLHGDWEPDDVPVVSPKHGFEAREALARAAAMAHLSEEHKRVLSLCDGTRRVREVAEALFPHAAGEVDRLSGLQRLLNICDELERMKLLTRRAAQR